MLSKVITYDRTMTTVTRIVATAMIIMKSKTRTAQQHGSLLLSSQTLLSSRLPSRSLP